MMKAVLGTQQRQRRPNMVALAFARVDLVGE
jgi:hypothetical protein